MKKVISITIISFMCMLLTACSSSGNVVTASKQKLTDAAKEPAQRTELESDAEEAQMPVFLPETEQQTEAEPVDAHSDILVAYFSATGTTKGVAEKIASITRADLYEILAAEPYTADDLNYSDPGSRATTEQNDKNARPAIGSSDISLEGYTTIYLGFPIWWGEEPRILDAFVEKYSFEGITVIPFCTSGSSGIGRSGTNLEALAGNGNWLAGERFSGSVSEDELQSWMEGLK